MTNNAILKNRLMFLALLGALAVILGAFGGHGLRAVLPEDSLDVWKTASQYHFIHTLAAFVPLLLPGHPRWQGIAFRFFSFGILCFSGSLYLLSTCAVHHLPVAFLGPVTPIGGVLLILGWVSLAWSVKKAP
ncbi:MAG: DUF423 domain-containing protein [Lewinellaceae bacterium]|nr:DUF423 domain-containing protein [Lewinellaceae bacterium]